VGEPDWASAEEVLFERSVAVIRQFATEHPDEMFATFFALDRGWENARYHVAHFTNQVSDWNQRGPFKYDLVSFVELRVWEDDFNSSEERPELEGRVIVSLWRVVDRLVGAGAFDGLRKSSFFRIAFSFHDDEMIVLRVLNWPEA
jgi:hypothetical protein